MTWNSKRTMPWKRLSKKQTRKRPSFLNSKKWLWLLSSREVTRFSSTPKQPKASFLIFDTFPFSFSELPEFSSTIISPEALNKLLEKSIVTQYQPSDEKEKLNKRIYERGKLTDSFTVILQGKLEVFVCSFVGFGFGFDFGFGFWKPTIPLDFLKLTTPRTSGFDFGFWKPTTPLDFLKLTN